MHRRNHLLPLVFAVGMALVVLCSIGCDDGGLGDRDADIDLTASDADESRGLIDELKNKIDDLEQRIRDARDETATDDGAIDEDADVSDAIVITTKALRSRVQGKKSSEKLHASGGSGSFSWSIASGHLPAGLALSESGTLSGAAADYGRFDVTIAATDTDDAAIVAEKDFSIDVQETIAITTLKNGETFKGSSLSLLMTDSLSFEVEGTSSGYAWSINKSDDLTFSPSGMTATLAPKSGSSGTRVTGLVVTVTSDSGATAQRKFSSITLAEDLCAIPLSVTVNSKSFPDETQAPFEAGSAGLKLTISAENIKAPLAVTVDGTAIKASRDGIFQKAIALSDLPESDSRSYTLSVHDACSSASHHVSGTIRVARPAPAETTAATETADNLRVLQALSDIAPDKLSSKDRLIHASKFSNYDRFWAILFFKNAPKQTLVPDDSDPDSAFDIAPLFKAAAASIKYSGQDCYAAYDLALLGSGYAGAVSLPSCGAKAIVDVGTRTARIADIKRAYILVHDPAEGGFGVTIDSIDVASDFFSAHIDGGEFVTGAQWRFEELDFSGFVEK